MSRSPAARADLAEARRRSLRYGIDPGTSEIPHAGEPGPAASAIRQLSSPVLDHLLDQIADSSLGIVLADRDGRVIRRDAATTSTLATMDDRSLDLGYSLAEVDVGTNGVGTSLETKGPAMVVGDQHFLECFQAFTCANAPILHPITRRVEGTVGVLCPVEDTGPLLLPTALQLSAQIGELLLDEATPEERFLLREFLRRRRSSRSAVATMGEGVLIATPTAQRLLAGADAAELWQRIEVAVRGGKTVELEHERTAQPPLRLRCRPLHRGGDLEGAIVELLGDPRSSGRAGRTRQASPIGGLVGVSDRWQETVRDAVLASQTREPVLIVGERGTGRLTVAEAIADKARSPAVEVLDATRVLVDGKRQWLRLAETALSIDGTVILRRVDHLPDDVAATLAGLVAAANDSAASAPLRLPLSAPAAGRTGPEVRVMATSETARADEPGRARLLQELDVIRVDVAPLRDRRDDIPVLLKHLARQLGRGDLDRRVVELLCRQPWDGNAAELGQVLRAAHTRATTGPLLPAHLPRSVRKDITRRPLHGLRQQEADAILEALRSTNTRAEAARQLGISRATLFRRINAYGLDVDDL